MADGRAVSDPDRALIGMVAGGVRRAVLQRDPSREHRSHIRRLVSRFWRCARSSVRSLLSVSAVLWLPEGDP